MGEPKGVSAIAKKRKHKSPIKSSSELKIKKIENDSPKDDVKENVTTKFENKAAQKTNLPTKEDIAKKYPVLQDKDLINKFLKVPFTNNQKGRIRQAIILQLKASNNHLNPDAIHGKLQSFLRNKDDLTDSKLRRIRVLYNLLNTVVTDTNQKGDALNTKDKKKKKHKKDKKEHKLIDKKEETGRVDIKEDVESVNMKEETEREEAKEENKEQLVKKVKGPKRYVVFVGNLPLGTNKEMILEHFSEFRDRIKSVRLPKVAEDKKTAIAFIELEDEPTYEMALSKHHTMLGNKRIKVLYSTQQNTKISKAEAKSKSAKLIAMQKTGKLLGSIPLEKKRSQRRLKKKKAQAKLAADSA